ncbi:AraC family transcriptional regulator [Lactobacillus mulieris]|uniref:AraC family transcriptional regulator n=1 Tax=Lactobacillus mulieris TaxID=2508708 RepID=A0AAW5WX69_9LACO|nr:AraC family transcriptional regulator [Lactobacillus mulieris]MCF1784300.1 AraC family transcriptional regulator [Lactobacillus mulieris]MCW8105059.1 AraC family transcriptional regulator [Lactobacillus mulieris]MCZ3621961.1 AraC family transcriptional regulator [Lactobacillus mulieris]MCZ3623658.1 AraC family transcriptional regulator [Lactobacillus mulieris]MCZ3635968.1 AraC family transcriptional regulator [Lactobacillus mulieris]
MAIFTLDQYLKGVIKNTKQNTNDLKLDSKNKDQKDFAIYVENHNGGIHRYHSQEEWLFVENGTCSIKFHNQILDLTAGNLVLIKAGQAFEIKEQTSETVVVKMRVKAIYNFEKELQNYLSLDDKENEILVTVKNLLAEEGYLFIKTSRLMKQSQLIENIINEYLNGDLFMAPMMAGTFSQLLALSLRMQTFNRTAGKTKKTNFIGSDLDRYIDLHFADIKLAEAAEYFGFNQNYFSNLVKQKTGKSFVEHVDERRMQEARELLAQPNLSLKEIISRVGYSSKSFFYKKFSEYYGTTPALMREELFRQANINLK